MLGPPSSVLGLLFPGRPLAILRRIWTVVVNSLDGQAGRLFSHVGKEVLKLAPALAHDDSPLTVKPVVWVLSICAAREHVRPRLIGPRVLMANRVSVSRKEVLERLFPNTPATRTSATKKVIAPDLALLTTITAGQDDRSRRSIATTDTEVFHHRVATKSGAFSDNLALGHGGPSKTVVLGRDCRSVAARSL